MKVTYLGTTVLLFDDGIDQILIDCHLTRPSLIKCLLGSLSTDEKVCDRVIRDAGIDRLRAIFVSHSHHDHVMDAPYVALQCGAEICGTASAANVARGGGVPEEKIRVFAPHETYEIGAYRITVLPSVHSKAHWYNNDLGQTIDEPVVQPAKKSSYKEGGSYDFLIEHGGRSYLVRPSYNYLDGELNGIHADVVFLGIAGLSKDTKKRKKKFFAETLEKVRPELVIPVHWDHFFTPLYGEIKGQPKLMENTGESIHELSEYCLTHGIACSVQAPLSYLNLP